MRSALYSLFCLSGISALVYGLVWQRVLHMVFGAGALASGALLATFMGGLALGDLAFGPFAKRTRRPLCGYAALETGVALTALLVPSGLALLPRVYSLLRVRLETDPFGGPVLSLVVILVPATVIGGRLPFLNRLRGLSSRAGSPRLGWFRDLNLLVLVVAVGLAGWLLVRPSDLNQSFQIAVGLNVWVALGALVLGFGGTDRTVDARLLKEQPLTDPVLRHWEGMVTDRPVKLAGPHLLGRLAGAQRSNNGEAFDPSKAARKLPEGRERKSRMPIVRAGMRCRDMERPVTPLEDLGLVRLVAFRDAAVARQVIHDHRLGSLCQLYGDRYFLFRAADEAAVRQQLRELGYVLKQPGPV